VKGYRAVRRAITALRRSPMRAMLTALGIIIGVGAVIAMMEIGAGSSSAIRKSISTMGANVLDLSPGAASSGGVTFGSGSTTTLTPADCEAIRRECPAVRDVAPLVHIRTQVIYGKSFRVVGTLGGKGANMMGMDQDDIILAPWTTLKYRVTGSALANPNQSAAAASSNSVNTLNKLYPGQAPELYPKPSEIQAANTPLQVRFANVDHILVAAQSTDDIPAAIYQITLLLRERHRIHPGEEDDFRIRDMTEMTKALSSTTTLMTNLLLCVAMISLVVGGVGIMNIMLVSVTERTREIGLRMAVGARARDILWQFLVEAVVLCLVGGSVGILLGHGGSRLVELLLRWPVETSPAAIAAAVIVSASVGIIFGFYPALKASRLDPIDALRYE
jgi:ABC-type antimicrobial peptide transport system permease subunit